MTLNDIPKDVDDWVEFSKRVLDDARASGRPVFFDLTNMEDIPGALANTGPYASAITSAELRYIRDWWQGGFDKVVLFFRNGQVVEKPW